MVSSKAKGFIFFGDSSDVKCKRECSLAHTSDRQRLQCQRSEKKPPHVGDFISKLHDFKLKLPGGWVLAGGDEPIWLLLDYSVAQLPPTRREATVAGVVASTPWSTVGAGLVSEACMRVRCSFVNRSWQGRPCRLFKFPGRPERLALLRRGDIRWFGLSWSSPVCSRSAGQLV